MAKLSIKGEISVLVDYTETEARLVFKPGADARDWSIEELSALIARRGISAVGRQAQEFFLTKAASSIKPFAIVIGRGTLPEQAMAESVEWSRTPIPDDLREMADTIVKGTPLPDLDDVAPANKGKTPAPAAKLSGTSLVKAGQSIGAVLPARLGKPGKNVFGKTISAPRGEAYPLAIDPSITKIGKEYFASRDGILRWGANWADIITFRIPGWDLAKTEDGSSVTLSYDPGDPPGAAPDAKAILDKARAIEDFKGELIDEETLKSALSSAAEEGKPLKGYYLSLDSDSKMAVTVSDDKMKAVLSLTKAKGRGKALSFQGLNDLIKAKGVKPRDPDRLRDDLNAFIKGPKAELKEYVLAEGRPPGQNADRSASINETFLSADETESLRKRLAALEPGLKDLKGLDEYPLLDFQKICPVREGKFFLTLSKADPGQPGVDAMGNNIPPIPGKCPEIKCYDNVRFSLDAVTPLVSGLLLYRGADGVISLRALAFRDAEASVSISQDELSAELSLFPGMGIGTPLSLELCLAALKSAGVVFGIDEEAVKAAVAETTASKTGKPTVKKVASGKPPRPQSSRRIDWQVKMATGKGVTLNSSGKADYRNQDRFTTVHEGEIIAVMHKQDDAGEAGTTVLGKSIEPPKSPESDTPQHDSTVREEAGENGVVKLVAAKTGELSFQKNNLCITAVLSIKGDVNMKTGNLRFPGNVTVSGSLASGFKLISGGDVSIGEGAEDSYILADGSVRMGQGIRGRNRGIIKAKKKIELFFAENATLLSAEDIQIKNACVSCTVKTNGKLSLLSEKGRLIGGEIRARSGIDVQSLGSESNVKTTVSFGQDYLILEQLEAEQKEIEKIKVVVLDYDRRMREAEKTADPALAQLRIDKAKLLKHMESRQVRFWFLDDKFEAHFPSEIRVRGTIYPGVVIESHNRLLEVREQKSKVRYYFDSNVGKIMEGTL